MELLQEAISGTFDHDSRHRRQADSMDCCGCLSNGRSAGSQGIATGMANIAVPNTDVRDDTVKRFVVVPHCVSPPHAIRP